MAYYRVEPFGEERADLRAGIVASAVGNFCGRPKSPFKPDDFMPLREPTPGEVRNSNKSLSRALRAAFQLLGRKNKEPR